MKIKGKIMIRSCAVSLFMILFCISAIAQDYTLNYKDASTFSVTCGSVNPAQWEVKNDSCILYTPVFYPVSGEGDSIMVSFTIRINQSGNLDPTDNAYIHNQRNSGTWNLNKKYNGADYSCVFTYSDSMKVARTDNFQFRIALQNNSKTNFWQIKDGDIQIHNVTYGGMLPVDLISFNGEADKNFVLLQWATASEVNNEYFTVEISENGVDFNTLGYVEGAGNSNCVLYYNCVDENPYQISYYRLRQTDYNGGFTYSEIIRVSLKESTDEEIIIAATGGEINVMTNNVESGQLHVNIYSLNGTLVYNNSINVEDGSNTISVKPDIEGNSIYLVSVSLNDQQPMNTKVYMN